MIFGTFHVADSIIDRERNLVHLYKCSIYFPGIQEEYRVEELYQQKKLTLIHVIESLDAITMELSAEFANYLSHAGLRFIRICPVTPEIGDEIYYYDTAAPEYRADLPVVATVSNVIWAHGKITDSCENGTHFQGFSLEEIHDEVLNKCTVIEWTGQCMRHAV